MASSTRERALSLGEMGLCYSNTFVQRHGCRDGLAQPRGGGGGGREPGAQGYGGHPMSRTSRQYYLEAEAF